MRSPRGPPRKFLWGTYARPVPPLLQISGVTKRYRQGRGRFVDALRGVDLEVARGEFLAIMGPSGSGKSTLFNLIGALDKPTAGGVTLGGLSLPRLRSRQLAYVRCRHIGYVFQAYNLVASLSAQKNVALPAVFGGAGVAEADERAAAQLEAVGLGHRLGHRPDQLSGGQQQRVAIARALVNEPALLLADEPTANLDHRTGGEVIDLFRELGAARGMTVVTTTHDHQMLKRSDRVAWIRDGRKVREAASAELDIREGAVG